MKLPYKTLFLLTLLPNISLASEDSVGNYVFFRNKFLGPKIAYDNITHLPGSNTQSTAGVYPGILGHQYNQFKNINNTLSSVLGYGDWKKDRRQIIGFEHAYKRNNGSKAGYDNRARTDSFVALTDKNAGKNLKLGGGLILSRADNDYSDSLADYMNDTVMTTAYAVYNNPENEVRLISRLFAGYSDNSVKRKVQLETMKADFDSYSYGLTNALSKNYNYDKFFIQPVGELNYYAVNNNKIKERRISPNALTFGSDDSKAFEFLGDLFFGFKDTNSYNHTYLFKAGPSWTYNFTDPADKFSGEDLAGNSYNIGKRYGERDYLTWKAFFNYQTDNGVGLYGDLRYINTDEPFVYFTCGVSYQF